MSTRRLQNRCEECDASCKECTAPGKGTNCTDCYHGFVLFKGVCLSGMCGTGFYQDQQKVRAIRRFRSSLIQDKIHIWNAQDVLALKGVGVGWRTIWLTDKKKLSLFEHITPKHSPMLRQRVCSECDPSCLTCKGPGPGNCVTCRPGPFALHRPTSKCVPCCIPNAYDNDACCICQNQREKSKTRVSWLSRLWVCWKPFLIYGSRAFIICLFCESVICWFDWNVIDVDSRLSLVMFGARNRWWCKQ